jgi:cell fate (sporulation/competence/biofilm development) regulator YlbF (YheA/YmcA/DUF963 family)
LTHEEIIKMAFELGSAVHDSDAMRDLQAIQQKITADQNTYAMIMKFQEAQGKLEMQYNEGKPIAPEQENYVKGLEEELNALPVVKELMTIQGVFDNLMQSIYYAINQSISGQSESSCSSGSCGTCGCGCEGGC